MGSQKVVLEFLKLSRSLHLSHAFVSRKKKTQQHLAVIDSQNQGVGVPTHSISRIQRIVGDPSGRILRGSLYVKSKGA